MTDLLKLPKNLSKKIANKLKTLTRIAPYLNLIQIRVTYNLIFKGQLTFYPLIWIFCSRRLNRLIDKLQEQALWRVFKDYNSRFSELLQIANKMAIHIRNLKNFSH